MPRITLIRHAESLFNANPSQDPKLINCYITEKGIGQAKELRHKFDLLILTPLTRSWVTYSCSHIDAREITFNSLFREYRQDICDFMKGEEIVQETEKEVTIRVKKAFDYLYTLKHANIGIIGHSDFFWYMVKELKGKDDHEVLKNCETISFTL